MTTLPPENNVAEEFHRIRRRASRQAWSWLAIFIFAIFAWAFTYNYFGGLSGVVYMIGIVPIMGVALFYVGRIEKTVVCPACRESLVSSEGWMIYEKECPHCGASYERHT